MAEATVIINVRVPLPLRKRLERLAVKNSMSLNRTVIEALEAGAPVIEQARTGA